MIEALELLHEEAELPDFDLPELLRDAYSGTLGFAGPTLVTNFVSTVDSVVSIPRTPRSNQLIGAGSQADKFVMALLRACADVVLIGSGTLSGSPRAVWTASDSFPPAAESLAELRRRLGLSQEPELAVVTASGSIDPGHPALAAGAIVLTTELGAAALDGKLRDGVSVEVLAGDERVDLAAAVERLRARGLAMILSEAGPTIFGSLLAAGLADELFLTVSPLLAGRSGQDVRLGLVEGIDLLPDTRVVSTLVGVRRHGAHLFLRYRLT